MADINGVKQAVNGTLVKVASRIPVAWGVVLAIGAIFVLGVTAGAWLVGIRGIPGQVSDQEARLQLVEQQIESWRPVLTEIPRLVTEMATLRRGLETANQEIRLSNCLMLAERRGEAYQQCLDR